VVEKIVAHVSVPPRPVSGDSQITRRRARALFPVIVATTRRCKVILFENQKGLVFTAGVPRGACTSNFDINYSSI
jgi:hypothetical protein